MRHHGPDETPQSAREPGTMTPGIPMSLVAAGKGRGTILISSYLEQRPMQQANPPAQRRPSNRQALVLKNYTMNSSATNLENCHAEGFPIDHSRMTERLTVFAGSSLVLLLLLAVPERRASRCYARST